MDKHTSKNQKVDKYVLGIAPTAERQRHQGGFRREYVKADGSAGIAVQRYRARWPAPLDLYLDMEIIDRDQHQAGLQFGRAYRQAVSNEAACHERARRIDSPPAASDMSDTPDGLQRALDYVEQAYAALSSDVFNTMTDVCAYERLVENPAAFNKLRKGLGRLALEWGMVAAELCHRRE